MTKSWPVAGANVIITYFFNIIEHLGSNSKRCSKQKGSRKETNNEKDSVHFATKRGEKPEKLITRLDRGSPRKLVTPYLDFYLFCSSPPSLLVFL